MGWFSDDSDQAQAYNMVQNAPPGAKLSHELVAGEASFMAARMFEDHEARNGRPENHRKAKEMLAGLTGAAVEKIVANRRLDNFDRDQAQTQAQQQSEMGLMNQNYY